MYIYIVYIFIYISVYIHVFTQRDREFVRSYDRLNFKPSV